MNIFFWDRTLASENRCTWDSIPEDCEPSWQGQFRGAMWASEYEEGWLTYEEVKQRRSRMTSQQMIPLLKHGKRFLPSERERFETEASKYRTTSGGYHSTQADPNDDRRSDWRSERRWRRHRDKDQNGNQDSREAILSKIRARVTYE